MQKKYKASTLLYTVLVAFIIFIILLSFIQISFFSDKFINQQILKDKLNDNIKSTLNVIVESPGYIEKGEIDLFENDY